MEGSKTLIARDESNIWVLSTHIIKNWQQGDDPMLKIVNENKDEVYNMYRSLR